MSKPVTRRSIRPSTRRVPNPDEIRRAATIERVMMSSSLERRIQALEQKLEALQRAPRVEPAPIVSLDEVTEHALEARLDALAANIEAAAAQRALDAVGPKMEELVSERIKKVKPSIDPRTILELVDQRIKESLDAKFRSMLNHIETDVVPRALRRSASGI
jgi:hypothetical protein